MLPPSDSFQHQKLKLAEVLAKVLPIEVPPPSYTAMPVTTADFHAYATDDEDDEDDRDYMVPPAPIVVRIDASVKIEGQGNTIVLPPTKPPSAQTPVSADRPNQTGHPQAERLTAAVLAALTSAGIVECTERRQRPLEVHVNASVNIKGEKNVICAGVPKVTQKGEDKCKKRRAESVCSN